MFLCVTVAILPMESEVCMTYEVFLEVILDRESEKKIDNPHS